MRVVTVKTALKAVFLHPGVFCVQGGEVHIVCAKRTKERMTRGTRFFLDSVSCVFPVLCVHRSMRWVSRLLRALCALLPPGESILEIYKLS